jgi:hypothetical membrane protein
LLPEVTMTNPLPQNDSTAARLTIAGLIAPVPFIALVILQGILQPSYSHVAHPISALAAFPLGWLQNINFYIAGTLMIAYAIGLHSNVRPARRGAIGPALIALSGLGLILCGVFPWRQENGAFIEPASHVVGAVMTFLGTSLGHIVISRRMRRDAEWNGIAVYVLASGTMMLLLFFAVVYALEPGSPLEPWAGAVQRVLVAVWFACMIVIALTSSRKRVNTMDRQGGGNHERLHTT